ncbi:MAG: Molybdopterin oxidoreductase, iron-sulfur binding subunit [Myxococcaceae bacterium]|nr:Molybdopterin oxidoreductase, iron-sulfur binding subunit [Myxococcaceae bacterium]
MSKRKPYQFSKPAADGKVFWTSLEAKADPEAHQKRATAEFIDGVTGSDLLSGAASFDQVGLKSDDSLRVDRRSFIGIAGAAGALLGLEGCIRRPEDKILPYTRQPEYVLPGIALHYATTARSGGDALGLLVTTHEGRPTKVEGNPNHPASLGATDGYAQASILDLYDPDRSRFPAQVKGGNFSDATYADVDGALAAIAAKAQADGGAKLRVLLQPAQSPTGSRVVKALLAKYPSAKVYSYEPVSAGYRQVGVKTAFGQAADVTYGYRRARTILALDADFLGAEPGSVRASREFADGRRLSSPRDTMNRLYVVEPGYTVTGAAADHRLRLPARDVGSYLKALAVELGALGVLANSDAANFDALRSSTASAKAPAGVSDKWLKSVAKELAAARGQSLIVVGTRQPAAVHALAFALNHALGNVGRTLTLVPALEAAVEGPFDGITALASEIQAGGVETLLILGGNPALDAPANLKFAELITKVPTSVHLSSYRDETSHVATWHVPRAHDFESWGDLRSSDGTISIQQPLIAPLHGGRTDSELLAQIAGIPFWRAHALVRSTAREVFTSDFEAQWKAALHLGVARELTVAPLATVSLDGAAVGAAVGSITDAKTALSASNIEVNFVPDPALFDGRHGNNPWMLELPDPLSCISWDNAAYISPATASALSVMNGDMVSIKDAAGNAIEIVTWVLPGQTDNTVTLHLGWGRTVAGRYGNHAGFNVYPIRSAQAFGFGDGFSVSALGKRYKVSQTQETHSMEGRAIAVEATLDEYKKQPEFAEYATPTNSVLPLWKEVKYEGHKWAMVIDLNACTGCNSCLVACQAENNVSSVGKEQVARGRDMYWLRLDRYFVGDDINEPAVAFQPVACQHCEEAPCENVCPVNATAHSPEGLNDMAYNRCIGTRYCMNNCPYKVRRFNFLDFTGQVPETRRMQYNPNVSVRVRGVMEKCSYCVQRIQEAKISARRDARTLRDGDIKVACQAACASGCITFGDLNDPTSRVAKQQKLDRQYKLLSELGVQPRTSYLARVRNPNPEMQG